MMVKGATCSKIGHPEIFSRIHNLGPFQIKTIGWYFLSLVFSGTKHLTTLVKML